MKLRLLTLISLIGCAVAMLGAATALGQNNARDDDPRRDATVNAVEKVVPSVVNVGTRTRRERRGYYYDWFRDNYVPYRQVLPPAESAGSGVIIDEEGYVLTNVHVVEDASEIWVTVDGKLFQADALVNANGSDVALLKIRNTKGEKFKAARFAADDDLLLGETVIALGNPYGLGGSVSKGILSAKNRREAFQSTGPKLDVPDWLQTDASINPGNSGGPLINLNGEVIGINVAVLKEGQGIGFAIPIKVVSDVLSAMYTPEVLRKLWFGATVKAGQYPLVINSVESDSPAAKAGLREGDLVLRVNNVQPRSFIEFSRQLLGTPEDKSVEVIVRRNKEEQVLKVRMVPEDTVFNNDIIKKRLGMELTELTAENAAALQINSDGGLIIKSVDRKGPAEEAGLKPGMIITRVEGREPDTVAWLARAVKNSPKGAKINMDLIVVVRRGSFSQLGNAKASLVAR